MPVLTQIPVPDKHQLFFRGDVIEFTLELDVSTEGRAFVRTNLENVGVHRREVLAHVCDKEPMLGQDWHDVPMLRVDERRFSIKIALTQVGHFEAKCLFIPEGTNEPAWPRGGNTHINVEPAEYCCANSVYCAFVRQFGSNKNKSSSLEGTTSAIRNLDEAGYAVIPPSGTFRDLVKELDFVVDELNCRIVHLLPINPTPTVFARMGRFGCPYAALDFTGIDPSLVEFDRKATPLDQFQELVDAVHAKSAKLFLDIAINHTGWASKLHETHPEWYARNADGSIVSPGAWGVIWGDLAELDHHRFELWSYLARVFLTWCRRGVDGFRCDAGYMIPFDAWNYIVCRVREEYPDVIFLLEGLGGDPAVTRRLLNQANMNWAYSELFQNYGREDIESYATSSALAASLSDGLLVHYAETHDNDRLAGVSPIYARMRTALCALLSCNGAFGFANGVEWFAREKIDVHEASALNWGSRENQVAEIARLNTILIAHPAFHAGAGFRFYEPGTDDGVLFVRTDVSGLRRLLVLVNLNCERSTRFVWRTQDLPFRDDGFVDLINERSTRPESLPRHRKSLVLTPGQAMCLSPRQEDLTLIKEAEDDNVIRPDKIDEQRAAALAFDLIAWKNRSAVVSGVELEGVAERLLNDPEIFFQWLFGEDSPLPVVHWRWPEDVRREVMIPPRHLLLVTASRRFRAAITGKKRIVCQYDSLKMASGKHFAVFSQLPFVRKPKRRKLRMAIFKEGVHERIEAPLLLLSKQVERVSIRYGVKKIREKRLPIFLQGNQRGGICRVPVNWGELSSRYDALLLANLNPNWPEDRHVMLRRFRVWLLFQGRSQELNADVMMGFQLNGRGGGTWTFKVPIGNGLIVDVVLRVSIVAGRNAVKVNAFRSRKAQLERLEDKRSIRLLMRPDIEDRNFHHETNASTGPEEYWPKVIENSAHGFTFSPDSERRLWVGSTKGRYRSSPEWIRGIHLAAESERGLNDRSDLFSPGYFDVEMWGGDQVELVGQVLTPADDRKLPMDSSAKTDSCVETADDDFGEVLRRAMDQFVVKRADFKSVVAGYPWFLDWGRDTLICVRGLVAAGLLDETREILLQFADFAENGTLPNMIHGEETGNRDTSDAPLWLFVACRDRCLVADDSALLRDSLRNGSTLLDALESIAEGYLAGAPNGITVDADSGLVRSPAHFTWMDTNYPACTPREGYPIEIQALWFAALSFLADSGREKWAALAEKVKNSIETLFIEPGRELGWLPDCLHAGKGVAAIDAVPDDHLRPNQLLAITLGAVVDLDFSKRILNACSSLLTPGAIRSLADRPVNWPLEIIGAPGKALGDSKRPYRGRYEGDEDTRRKPAYHNGTAWTWLFPSYCEAYFKVYGEMGRAHARSILSSSIMLLENGCLGQVPEILDGDYPHRQRGCDAQAWGVTELFRVWKALG